MRRCRFRVFAAGLSFAGAIMLAAPMARAAEMLAKYQSDTRLGDFAATCLAITLTPSARTQS